MSDEKVGELAREYVSLTTKRDQLVREVEVTDQDIRRVEDELVGSFEWGEGLTTSRRIFVRGVSDKLSVMLCVRDCSHNKVDIEQPDVFVPPESPAS